MGETSSRGSAYLLEVTWVVEHGLVLTQDRHPAFAHATSGRRLLTGYLGNTWSAR